MNVSLNMCIITYAALVLPAGEQGEGGKGSGSVAPNPGVGGAEEALLGRR